MRDVSFVENEFYHIYNRGVDKRNIITNQDDFERFFQGVEQFNTPEVLGSIDRGHRVSTSEKLVEFVAYSVNPNHFHFILEQVADKGIEKFMHKLGMGYAKYFNTKYKRSGALFQGKFKAKLIDSNEYLLHLSAYVNLNHMGHGRGYRVSTLNRTSWEEYIRDDFANRICNTKIILDQFKSRKEYRKFAEESLQSIIERKILLEELGNTGIELANTL